MKDTKILEMPISDFQKHLALAFQAAVGTDANFFIRFKIQGAGWVLSLKELRSIINYPKVVKLGNLRPWVLGVANYKGASMAVIDMTALFSGVVGIRRSGEVISVVHNRYNTNVAFLWQEVVSMERVERFTEIEVPEDLGEVPLLFTKKCWKVLEGAGVDGINVWMELDIEKLLNSDYVMRLVEA